MCIIDIITDTYRTPAKYALSKSSCPLYTLYLVGGWAIPLKNISQLGWWTYQYMENKSHVPVTTNQLCFVLHRQSPLMLLLSWPLHGESPLTLRGMLAAGKTWSRHEVTGFWWKSLGISRMNAKLLSPVITRFTYKYGKLWNITIFLISSIGKSITVVQRTCSIANC